MKVAEKPMTGLHKAAILMVMLGDDAASMIYRHLPERDVQEITREIADLGNVTPDAVSLVFDEYYRLTKTQEFVTQGGGDYAKKLLVKAFGEENARELLEQVERSQEDRDADLESLKRADPQQLAKFIQAEHPQTIALITAHLDSKQAAAMISLLNNKTRADVARRLAEMRNFSPDMAQKISTLVNKRLKSLVKSRQRGFAGMKAVAEMLNRMEPALSKEILEGVEGSDAQVAIAIRNLMFTFEDLIAVPDASVREIVSQVDKKVLATALKGASDEVKNHIFKCMSSRAAEMLKEDMEVLGPLRSREVQHAQQETINLARDLEEAGKIVLKTHGDDEYVV